MSNYILSALSYFFASALVIAIFHFFLAKQFTERPSKKQIFYSILKTTIIWIFLAAVLYLFINNVHFLRHNLVAGAELEGTWIQEHFDSSGVIPLGKYSIVWVECNPFTRQISISGKSCKIDTSKSKFNFLADWHSLNVYLDNDATTFDVYYIYKANDPNKKAADLMGFGCIRDKGKGVGYYLDNRTIPKLTTTIMHKKNESILHKDGELNDDEEGIKNLILEFLNSRKNGL